MVNEKVNTVVNPSFSGVAALSTLANYHGLQGDVREFARIVGMKTAPKELGDMLAVAAQLGLQAIPMEGRFEQLRDCEFPLIVALDQEAEGWRFAVVFEVLDNELRVGDPEEGLIQMSEDAFRLAWEQEEGTGDVIAIDKGPLYHEIAARLVINRSPMLRLKHALGLQAPWGKKIVFVLGLLVTVVGITLWSREQFILHLCLGAAVLGSWWSYLFASTCGSCSRAGKLVGAMPLGAMGLIGYAVMLVASLFGFPEIAVIGLIFASGMHVKLVEMLVNASLWCVSCLLTATGAFVGAIHLGMLQVYGPFDSAWFIAGFACVEALARFAPRRYLRLSDQKIDDLAKQVAAEPLDEGKHRAVVYKKNHCKYCLQFSATIQPTLLTIYPDLQFEIREVDGWKMDVPVMIVRGKRDVVVTQLRDAEALDTAVRGVSYAMGDAEEEKGNFRVILDESS